MIKSLTLAAAFICVGAAVHAQDLEFSMGPTDSCLTDSSTLSERESCIGASARMCMQDTQGGHSTVGMGGCLDAERASWDGRLNAVYKHLMVKEKAEDADMAEMQASAPKKAKALRDMQRAWISYRDMRCGYVGSQWGGGSGTGPAIIDCHMNMTGRQALFLQTIINN